MTEARASRHGLEPFLASCPVEESGKIGVTIRLQSGLCHTNLRGDPENAGFIAAACCALGQELPISPNTMSSGDHEIFWLGPDEWLIVTSLADNPDLLPRLRESLAGLQVSVTDVSGGQIVMRLTGPGVRDVLAKGCTLDFHPDHFAVGSCAQSGLAKANVLIGLVDDRPTFEVITRRSFSDYVARWLRHSAGEYGVKFFIT